MCKISRGSWRWNGVSFCFSVWIQSFSHWSLKIVFCLGISWGTCCQKMVILSQRLMRDFKWAPTRIFLHISLWLAPSAMLKIWRVHEKERHWKITLESVIRISLLISYLFFSPWRFVDLVRSVAAHRKWVHLLYRNHWVCFMCAIQPLLWLTLGLLNVHILPELPMCRRPNSVRGKTVAYGIQLFCRLLYEPPS